MSGTNNERNPHLSVIPIGTQAADVVLPGLYFRKRSRIKNVWLVDQAGIASDGTNKILFTLQDGSAVAYASQTTNGHAAVALTPLLLPLSTPVGDVANQPEADVPAGTILNVNVDCSGTVTTTKAVLIVEHYPL